VKRAKRKLGDTAEDAPMPTAGEDDDRPGAGATGAADAQADSASESVETMLQEFGAQRAAPAPRSQVGGYDQLWQLSMADPHTGLVNQLLLLDRLAQALVRRQRHGGEVVVCRVELDNLARINLDLGYTAGNEVLSDMARRLTSVLRAEDTIGRVSGTEVVVVVTVTDEQAVGPLLRRIQHVLDEVITVDGIDVHLHASLGVAMAEDDESAEDVLGRAGRSTRVVRR